MVSKLSLKLCPAVITPGVTLCLCANEQRQRGLGLGVGAEGGVRGGGRGQRLKLKARTALLHQNWEVFNVSSLEGVKKKNPTKLPRLTSARRLRLTLTRSVMSEVTSAEQIK